MAKSIINEVQEWCQRNFNGQLPDCTYAADASTDSSNSNLCVSFYCTYILPSGLNVKTGKSYPNKRDARIAVCNRIVRRIKRGVISVNEVVQDVSVSPGLEPDHLPLAGGRSLNTMDLMNTHVIVLIDYNNVPQARDIAEEFKSKGVIDYYTCIAEMDYNGDDRKDTEVVTENIKNMGDYMLCWKASRLSGVYPIPSKFIIVSKDKDLTCVANLLKADGHHCSTATTPKLLIQLLSGDHTKNSSL